MRLQKTHISLSLVYLKSNLENKWKKDKVMKVTQGVKIFYGMRAKREEGQK